MMTGIYTYSVDPKGRIVMPNRFRGEIGDQFVLGGHPNGYLVAASSPELLGDKNSVRSYVECQIRDRTGRFVIPSALRDFAELASSGEATVVGHGDEVEIWSKRKWETIARLGSGPARPQVDGPRDTRGDRSQFKAPNFSTPYPVSDLPGANAWQRSQSTATPYPAPTRQHSPFERVEIQQTTVHGAPYIKVEGPIGVGEAHKVITKLQSTLRSRPHILYLDLRQVDTIDACMLLALGPISHELAASGGRLAILSHREDFVALVGMVCPPSHTRVLRDLEAVTWWLVDEGHA